MDCPPLEKPDTLKASARHAIKNLLVTGKLERGALYSANTFADLLKVSRTPIREALLELSAEGYLVAQDGRGFRVRSPTADEIRDFFETRKIIELYVIERVIATRPAECLEELRAHQRRMRESFAARDNVAFLDADKAFHLHLIHCHHNRYLTRVMNTIRDLISILGHAAIIREGRTEQVLREHQAIINAVAARAPGRAVEAMRIHLDATEGFLLRHLSPASAP